MMPISWLTKSDCIRTALGCQLVGSEPLNVESERRVFAFEGVALCFQGLVALSASDGPIC